MYTLTLSPPSSVVSAPHSGVVARTFSAAFAGKAATSASMASMPRSAFMNRLLELVRAVRANGVDVLKLKLAIALVEPRLIPRVLAAQARELAWTPVEHDREAIRRGREQ